MLWLGSTPSRASGAQEREQCTDLHNASMAESADAQVLEACDLKSWGFKSLCSHQAGLAELADALHSKRSG